MSTAFFNLYENKGQTKIIKILQLKADFLGKIGNNLFSVSV
jgi:hypothetical protein